MHRLRRTHKVDKSLWSISPVIIDCLVGKKYYSSFSSRNCELETERNWRTFQFFLDLFDWGECSISSSCCGEGGEERFLWPGERRERSSMSCRVSTIRSVLKTNRGVIWCFECWKSLVNWAALQELFVGWRDSVCQDPHSRPADKTT